MWSRCSTKGFSLASECQCFGIAVASADEHGWKAFGCSLKPVFLVKWLTFEQPPFMDNMAIIDGRLTVCSSSTSASITFDYDADSGIPGPSCVVPFELARQLRPLIWAAMGRCASLQRIQGMEMPFAAISCTHGARSIWPIHCAQVVQIQPAPQQQTQRRFLCHRLRALALMLGESLWDTARTWTWTLEWTQLGC